MSMVSKLKKMMSKLSLLFLNSIISKSFRNLYKEEKITTKLQRSNEKIDHFERKIHRVWCLTWKWRNINHFLNIRQSLSKQISEVNMQFDTEEGAKELGTTQEPPSLIDRLYLFNLNLTIWDFWTSKLTIITKCYWLQ